MKDKIKEKLEKGLDLLKHVEDYDFDVFSENAELLEYTHFQGRLKQHEETKKAERERFLRLIERHEFEHGDFQGLIISSVELLKKELEEKEE